MQFKPSRLTSALALACASMHSFTAFAADDNNTLGDIVVSASRAPTALAETPTSVGHVDLKAIDTDKPKSVGEVINQIPGVYWNDLGNEQHSMAIRQPISTNPVYQYLEDGIPIRPLGVFNHNALNEMNLDGTDSVEVIKGPASSLYGSNAVGGAVNFITADPSRTPYFSSSYRRDNISKFQRLDVNASNTWDKLGIRVSGYQSHRDSNNWQQYSYGDKDAYTLRADYALNDTSRLKATLVQTNLDTAMTGTLFENDYRNNPGKSLNTFTYRKDRSTRMNVAWEGETLPDGITTVTAFYRNNDHGQIPSYTISGCAGTTCKGTQNNNHVDSLGLDIKHEQGFAWLQSRLVSGVYLDFSNNPYVSNNLSVTRNLATGQYVSYALNNAANPTGVRNYEAQITNRALFAQFEFTPIEKTRVVLGGRSDSIRYDFTNFLSPGGSADFGAPNETREFSHFSPKAGATYSFTAQTAGYVNLSEGFTPPEVSQLYGKTAIPNLRPATYNNYELGFRHSALGGALKFDSALYRLDGRDTIVNYTIAPGNSENRNAGKTRSSGFELGVNYAHGPVDARFGGSWAVHRFIDYQASSALDYSGKEQPQAPHQVLSAELGYKPLQTLRVAVEAIKLGEYWMDNANTVQYPGHSLFNLKANWQVHKTLAVWAQVRNLLDRRYADNASSSYSGVGVYSPNTQNQYQVGAPRTLMAGLTYTLE